MVLFTTTRSCMNHEHILIKHAIFVILLWDTSWNGAWDGVVVKALRYKQAGRGFDSRWFHWNFHWHNPSGRTMALGSTQSRIEMNMRSISWGYKGGRCIGLTTLPHLCTDGLEIREPQPTGTFRACPGLHKDYFTFTKKHRHHIWEW